MQAAEVRHSSPWSHDHRGPEGTDRGGMLSPQPHVGCTEVTPLKHDAFCGEPLSGQGMGASKSLEHLPKTRRGKLPEIHPRPSCGHLSASPAPPPRPQHPRDGWLGVHVVEVVEEGVQHQRGTSSP